MVHVYEFAYMPTSESGSGTSTPSTHSSDDEWEEVTNTSRLPGIDLPGIDVLKFSSTSSGSSKEPFESAIAKLSAMQNVFLFMKVHVDPAMQKPLSRRMLLEHIRVALYEQELNPTEIVDYVGKTPRTLPEGEELLQWRVFNQARDSNGTQYGEKRLALNLCEEVMNLCIDVYLDMDSALSAWKEETKRIKVASAATRHTTATTGKGKGKEVDINFHPTEKIMNYATPWVNSTSCHPAKLQTCVPPLKGPDEINPRPPKVIAPSTALGTASAPHTNSQDVPTLLSKAKEIHTEVELVKKKLNKSTAALIATMAKDIQAEAELVKKKLNKSTAVINEPLAARKLHPLDNIVSYVQLPSTHPVLKDESRPFYTQSKQGNSPSENPKTAITSMIPGRLNDEPMKPLYTRFGANEASLWTASPIHVRHGFSMDEKSWHQQLSDQLDLPPMAYDGEKSSASLWSKNNTQLAPLAGGPKPDNVVKDGKLVGNPYDLNRHCDITDAAGTTAATLAALTPTQKSEKRLTDHATKNMLREAVSYDSKKRRIGEIEKADAEKKAVEVLAWLMPTQKLDKTGTSELERLAATANAARNTETKKRVAEAALLAPTQRCDEKPSSSAVSVHGWKAGDSRMNDKVTGSALDLSPFSDMQKRMKASLDGKRVEPALTPTQKFEKILTGHTGSNVASSHGTLMPPGYPNGRLTDHFEKMKYAGLPELAAQKNAAAKATDRVTVVKEHFKQGPVTPPTRKKFEQGRATSQEKEAVASTKKEVRYSTLTEQGDDGELPHWAKIASVPIVLFILCTFIQIMMNLGTIMCTIASLISSCLSLCMDYTGYFWTGVWWLTTAPFLLFSGFVNQGMGLAPDYAAVPPSAPPIIIEPRPPTILAMQEAISLWNALGAEKAKHPQCENSLQISSKVSADSSSGIEYKSVHTIGNSGWMVYSDYPFTRHNNSLPEADRCEHFVKSFQHFWKEEMEEKKEKEREEGRFDLALGNDIAEALLRHCK